MRAGRQNNTHDKLRKEGGGGEVNQKRQTKRDGHPGHTPGPMLASEEAVWSSHTKRTKGHTNLSILTHLSSERKKIAALLIQAFVLPTCYTAQGIYQS